MECFKMLKLGSKTVTFGRYSPILENPTDITRKLLDLINGFNNVAGHKTNTQKSVVFLYSTSKISERN